MSDGFTIQGHPVGGSFSSTEFPAPDGTFYLSKTIEDDAFLLEVDLESIPDGAAKLSVWAVDLAWEAVYDPNGSLWRAELEPPLAGLNSLKPPPADASTIRLAMAFRDDTNAIGTISSFQTVLHLGVIIGDEPPFPDLVQLTAAGFSAGDLTVGETLQDIQPTFNVEPVSLTPSLEFRAVFGTGSYSAEADTAVLLAGHIAGGLRRKWVAVGPAGDTLTVYSDEIGPILDEPATVSPQLQPADVVMVESFYVGTAGIRFKPRVQFPNHLRATYPDAEFRWATTNLGVEPIDWQPMEEISTNNFKPMEPDAEDNDPDAIPRVDFSSFLPGDPARDKFRFQWREDDTHEWSIPSVMAWRVPDPTPVVVVDDAWRQILIRHSGQFGPDVTPDKPELYDQGRYGTDSSQWFTSMAVSAKGKNVALAQDSANIRWSTDFCNSVGYHPNVGLRAHAGCSVWFDPLVANEDTCWAIMSPGLERASGNPQAGIYKTVNAGAEWVHKKQIDWPGDVKFTRGACFSRWPATGAATKMYAVASRHNGSTTTDLDGIFLRSDDGGENWNHSVSLPIATFGGRIYGVEKHPTSTNHVLIWCQRGLFRSTTDGATTGSFVKSWTTGLPQTATADIRSFWRDPDNVNHIYVSVNSTVASERGIWESTNGTAFTRIYSALNPHTLAVGAKNGAGQRMLYVTASTETVSPHIRLLDGTTWITQSTAAPNRITFNALGANTNLWHFSGFSFGNNGQQLSGFVPHPTDPLVAFGQGRTAIWSTKNGKDFVLSGAGFGGFVHRDIDWKVDDEETQVGAIHDVGVYKTTNHTDTCQIIKWGPFKGRASTVIAGSPTGVPSFTGTTIVILPNDASITTSGNRGRIIIGAGNAYRQVMGYIDHGDTEIQDWMGATPVADQSDSDGGGWGHRRFSGYLPHNPNKVWVGPSVSEDGTTSWDRLARPIFGCVGDGTDTVYGYDTSGVLSRSANFGDTWTTWVNLGAAVIDITNSPMVSVNPMRGDRVAAVGSARSLRILTHDTGTGAAASVTIDLSALWAGVAPMPYDAYLNFIRYDARDPRYLYVAFRAIGNPRRVFRLKLNAAGTGLDSWVNITENSPMATRSLGLYAPPESGGLIARHDGVGLWCKPPPSDWRPLMGQFHFASQPAAASTLTVNGQTVTFVASGATGLQVNIGVNLAATIANLETVLNASANTSITPCTYEARSPWLDVYRDTTTVLVTHTFTLVASGGSNATVRRNRKVRRGALHANLPLPIFEDVAA